MTSNLPPSLWKSKTKPTILRFYIGGSGDDIKKEILEAETKVTKTVNRIIRACKKKGGERFSDPDFGPSEADPFGAFAMYKEGKVCGRERREPYTSTTTQRILSKNSLT
jgi:hypothetical protein